MRTTQWARSILCDNPSPMTLEGTLTYVLGGPDDDVLLVDPGPDGHPEHLEAVAAEIGERRVDKILVTHRHRDHTGAAAAFAEHFGAPVRGFSAAQCRPGPDGAAVSPLADGEILDVGGRPVEVLHTPGHTSDSICLWLAPEPSATGPDTDADTEPDAGPDTGAMLTGDTILGRGTTMLDFPDGTLTDYLHSLHRLSTFGAAAVLPAHGPQLESLGEVVAYYLGHREERLDQVRALLDTHGTELSDEELAQLIYGDSIPAGSAVTAKIVGAQVDHLRHLGELGQQPSDSPDLHSTDPQNGRST